MKTKRDYKDFDIILVLLVCSLVVMGIIVIGSARKVYTGENLRLYYNQMLWLALGFAVMMGAAFIDYRFIAKFYVPAYVVINILLVSVAAFSTAVRGGKRWIDLFGDFGLQPSEYAKIIMIICLAKLIDKKKEKINNVIVLIGIFIFGFMPVVFIFIQSSLSACLVVFFILVVMLFCGGVDMRYFITFTLVALISITAIISDVERPKGERIFIDIVLQPYQVNRIRSVLHPEEKDAGTANAVENVEQALKALNAGQLKGVGLYKGTTRLPEKYNDFIFAFIGEEFGFAGCVAILVWMMLIIVRCLLIAARAPDNLGRYIACGVAGMLAFQVFVHVCVNTGMLPPTGMILPFVSYGGSSMLTNMASIGLVVNIGMTKQKSFFEGA